MSLTGLFLGLALLGPVPATQADTVRAPKPKREAPAPIRPAPQPTRSEPRLTPKGNPAVKPLPLGEPRLKRRKPPELD